jgi:ribosomal protein S7
MELEEQTDERKNPLVKVNLDLQHKLVLAVMRSGKYILPHKIVQRCIPAESLANTGRE